MKYIKLFEEFRPSDGVLPVKEITTDEFKSYQYYEIIIGKQQTIGYSIITPSMSSMTTSNIIDEIKLIHIIQSCSIFVVSWGTSFFKNFIYISDKCKKIIVLILQNSNFYNQYLDHKPHLSTMYKNAQIEYIVTDSSLNNILF